MLVTRKEWSLSNPITRGNGKTAQFVCEGCCCDEVSLLTTLYIDGEPAVLCTCPHIDIWIRDASVIMAATKGVRH